MEEWGQEQLSQTPPLYMKTLNWKFAPILFVAMSSFGISALSFAQEQGQTRDRKAIQYDEVREADWSNHRGPDSTAMGSSGSSFPFWANDGWDGNCELDQAVLDAAGMIDNSGSYCYTLGNTGTFTGTQSSLLQCMKQDLSSGEFDDANDSLCEQVYGPKERNNTFRSCSVTYPPCPTPPSPFILVFDLPNPNMSVRLPFRGTYNVTVDWGDGNDGCTANFDNRPSDFVFAPTSVCTYTTAGEKIIRINGSMPEYGYGSVGSFPPNSSHNYQHLIRVDSFGNIGLTKLPGAFPSARLETVPSQLPLGVDDLSYAFAHALVFNSPNISDWNTQDVTTLEGTFRGATLFNQALNWDTTLVTNFRDTFTNASWFNNGRPVGDVSNPLAFNTQNAIRMDRMFFEALRFNQNLDSFNTINNTTTTSMFQGAQLFNNGRLSGDYSAPLNFDMANVTEMTQMFYGASAFNQFIGNWNTSGLASGTLPSKFNGVFYNASAFNNGQPAGFSTAPLNWNTTSVTSLINVFRGASSFNQPISTWNVSQVTTLNQTFMGASMFNQSINSWNTSAVQSMVQTFQNATSFNQPLNAWNTAALGSLSGTFQNASAFNQPLNNWITTNVGTMTNTFRDATSFNQSICNWGIRSPAPSITNFKTGSVLSDSNSPKFAAQPTWGSNCP